MPGQDDFKPGAGGVGGTGSAGGILEYIRNSPADEFIIGTEQGIFHPVHLAHPGVTLYLAAEELLCPNMKSITLEKVLYSMDNLETKVSVPEYTAVRARAALEKMIEYAG